MSWGLRLLELAEAWGDGAEAKAARARLCDPLRDGNLGFVAQVESPNRCTLRYSSEFLK